MPVTVVLASRSQEPVLQHLFQLYTHDFSDFWVDTERGDLQSDGRFAEYPLDEYWTVPSWSASLIWRDEVLAGFVLLNNRTHTGGHVDHNVAEFFILRKHRGRGVGRQAAALVFSQYPGTWEVAIARKNVHARSFWRGVVHGAPQAANVNEIDVNDQHWNGSVLRFEWQG
jgi:predicted acetyltransferase